MYLTRFRVNTARREARSLLGSPHRLHGAVTMSFPEPPPRDGTGPRVLWRVDQNSRAETLLYLVSPGRPDLTHLVEQAGWPASDTPGWQTYPYGSFLDALTEGGIWAFRLTANPVHNVRVKDGQPTKRTAHITPHHQAQWLLKQQEKVGFEVVEKPAERRLTDHGDRHELIVHGQRGLRFGKVERGDPHVEQRSGHQDGQQVTRRPGGRTATALDERVTDRVGRPGAPRRQEVTLTAVTYDGRLRVTDADALRHALTHGLGKAKAYGCGLMTLAPVR